MKRNLNLVLCLLCAFFYNCAVAQNNDATHINISGKLVDDAGQPVERATVTLFKNNASQPIRATYTSNSGNFLFYNLPYGSYSISLTHIGLERKQIDQVTISSSKHVAGLGTIILKHNGDSLAGVTVTDARKTVAYKAGKFTYNPAESLQAEGATAIDLLQNAPMVDVDPEGDITIAGRTDTRIFIDGRPSDYTSADIPTLLAQMPSDIIDRIEVLDNPPARYAADGQGIINIVLKERRQGRFRSTASGSGTTLGNLNLNNYTTYGKGRFSLTAGYTLSRKRTMANGYALSTIYPADTLFYTNSFSNRNGYTLGINLNTAANLILDGYRSLRVATGVNVSNSDLTNSADAYYLDKKAVTSSMFKQLLNNHGHCGGYMLDADYTWRDKRTDEKFTAGAAYNSTGLNYSRFLHRDNMNGAGQVGNLVPVQQTFNVDGDIHLLELNADYFKRITGYARNTMNMGFDATFQTFNNNQVMNRYNYTTKAYSVYLPQTNNYNYSSNVYAAYLSFDVYAQKKWLIRAGGRGELTDARYGLSQVVTPGYAKSYANFFPNLLVSRTFRSKYTFELSYSERIVRPRDRQLDPQTPISDSASVSFGNPNLDPSHIRQAGLSLGVVGQSWSVYPVFTFMDISNNIQRLIAVTATGVGQVTYYNVPASHNYMLAVNGNYRLNTRLVLNGGINYSYISFKGLPQNTISGNGNLLQMKAGSLLNFNSRSALECNIVYYKNTLAQTYRAGFYTTTLGIRESFMNNNMRVRLLASNLFATTANTSLIRGSNFDRLSNSLYPGRSLSLVCSYNLIKR